MDITFFAVDWERLFEVLSLIVVLSFLVERALAVLFESRWWVHRMKNRGLKEPVAFALSLLICRYWHIDAISLILRADASTWIGYIVTAGVIAGGSKASIKLFTEVLQVKSGVVKQAEEATATPPANPQPPAASPGGSQ